MTAFVVTTEKQREVVAAIAEARANVVPWSATRHLAVATETDTLLLSERPPGSERRPASIAVHFDGGITVAISFEEQPIGIIRHVSFSTGRPGEDHLVHPVIAAMICRLFGVGWPPRNGRCWVEEYQPNYFAVNVAEIEVEREAGHA